LPRLQIATFAKSRISGENAVMPNNVIPFRRRPPSKPELEVYRWMTRRWSTGMKILLFPQFHSLETGNRPGAQKSSQPAAAR
jgi:hypothetical protein